MTTLSLAESCLCIRKIKIKIMFASKVAGTANFFFNYAYTTLIPKYKKARKIILSLIMASPVYF